MVAAVIAAPESLAANDAYLETQVMTASPTQLRLMLIEGALRFAQLALEAHRDARADDADRFSSRCRDILMELLGSLQPQGNPVAQNLVPVYAFMVGTASEALIRREPQRLEQVCQVLVEEQITWRTLVERVAPGEPTTFDDPIEASSVRTLTAPVERFVLDM